MLWCWMPLALGLVAPAELTARCEPAAGWMAGGWGAWRVTLRNTTAGPLQVTGWTARWYVDDRAHGEPWSGSLEATVAAGQSWERREIGSLPTAVADAAGAGAAQLRGVFHVRQGAQASDLPFAVAIPAARLPEPLRRVAGKTVALELMESRFAQFRHLDRTLRWLDQGYQAMIDLTGERPFGGRAMVYRESPEHPWWAYAGETMVLNTKFVGETLREFDDGLLSFGWIHEVGHNFDTLGKWYLWSGPAAEWQANFKLAYALETIPDQSFRLRWTFEAPGYPSNDRNLRLTGRDFVERFFLLFGDQYLADPQRTFESLSSDEIHGCFQRLQRAYGWEPFRQWYRTYRRLADAGHQPPTTPAAQVSLLAAILGQQTRVDLVPTLQRWRFPVTAQSVAAAREKYALAAR